MRFSERHGYTPVKDVVQRERIDADLRVGLWNVLDLTLWSRWKGIYIAGDQGTRSGVRSFAQALWHSYFKWPTDTIPSHAQHVAEAVRKYFFDCQWYEIFNLLEFIVERNPRGSGDHLTTAFNSVLEREVSAYRFVAGEVVEITSPEEIAAVEEALNDTEALGSVHTHLRTALEMMADRASPDYRNSIKESISAVEALVNRIEGRKGTLGSTLKKLGIDAHPALREAFNKLYGYTSDAEGIRRALIEEDTLEFEDAKFMLVSCAAFVSYLTAKAARKGIAL
jgi:hypothetical protein